MDIGHPKYDPASKDAPSLDLPSWVPGGKKPAKAPIEVPKKTKHDITAASTITNPSTQVAKPDPSTNSGPTTIRKEEKKDYYWPAYLGGIIGVAVVAYIGIRAASSLFDIWTNLEPTTNIAVKNSSDSSEKPAAATTDTAAAPALDTAAAAAATTTATPAAEAPAPATPAPAPTIDKASLVVKVLNGSGVPGAADKAADVLTAASIPVKGTGNARRFSYDTTIVYYPAGKADQAKLVADTLTGYSVSTEENAVANDYDALVVVGAK